MVVDKHHKINKVINVNTNSYYQLGKQAAANDLFYGLTKVSVDELIAKLAEPQGRKVMPGSRRGGKNEPTTSDPAGSGGRFKAMVNKLKHQKGVRDPKALAGAIARSKFGQVQ